MIPSNYEWIINFLKRLREKEPKALADVKRIRDDYQRIVARGHGVLAIPEHVPITFGQSTWLTIGEKYIVLALRSEKVRTYPGYYHMIGGVPFHAK
ncbi:MAG: hypothetical protein U1C71_02985, partial [archaeon]|nr:hypothetical protein [archaeon]